MSFMTKADKSAAKQGAISDKGRVILTEQCDALKDDIVGRMTLAADSRDDIPDFMRLMEDNPTPAEADAAVSVAALHDAHSAARLAIYRYRLGLLSTDALTSAISAVWTMRHDELMWARPTLEYFDRLWFPEGRFTIPPEIADDDGRVTLYRGTSRCDPKRTSEGISWTTSKSRAEFFAYKHRAGKNPNVETIRVPLKDIRFHTNAREENECIVMWAFMYLPGALGGFA